MDLFHIYSYTSVRNGNISRFLHSPSGNMRIGSLLVSATWSLNLKNVISLIVTNRNVQIITASSLLYMWGKCSVTVWPLGVGPSLQTSRTRCEDRPSTSPSEWPQSDHHGPDPPDPHRETELMHLPHSISTQTSHYHGVASVTGQNDDVDRWGVIGHTDSSIFGFILTLRKKS